MAITRREFLTTFGLAGLGVSAAVARATAAARPAVTVYKSPT